MSQITTIENSSIDEIYLDNKNDSREASSSSSSVLQKTAVIRNEPISIVVDAFGTILNPKTNKNEIVRRYTFLNNFTGLSIEVINFGAIVRSIKIPNKYGVAEDCLLGFDTITDYMNMESFNIGCVSAKICNNFYSNQNMFLISAASDSISRIHKSNWHTHLQGNILTLTHIIENIEPEHYPGPIMFHVTYELKADNQFLITMNVHTSTPIPIHLMNGLYFNLGGHGSGSKELYKHVVTLNGDKCYVKNGSSQRLQCVGGTIYDLRIPHELGPAIGRCPNGGYAENYRLTRGTEQRLIFAGRTAHSDTGRTLEMYTNQPNVLFYTTNDFPDPFNDINPIEAHTQNFFEIPGINKFNSITQPYNYNHNNDNQTNANNSDDNVVHENAHSQNDEIKSLLDECCACNTKSSCSCPDSMICSCSDIMEPINGKNGAEYLRHGAFSMISQNYPYHFDDNSIRKSLQSVVQPGDSYHHEIIYIFDTIIRNKATHNDLPERL